MNQLYSFSAKSVEDLKGIAKKFVEIISDKQEKTILFVGEMGAGKTTFIASILKELGIDDHISSPTFSIVNEYFSVNYGVVYHFDFYRIEDELEAINIGTEEIFEEDAWKFIEWPQKVSNLLPENFVKVTIVLNPETLIEGEEERKIEVEFYD